VTDKLRRGNDTFTLKREDDGKRNRWGGRKLGWDGIECGYREYGGRKGEIRKERDRNSIVSEMTRERICRRLLKVLEYREFFRFRKTDCRERNARAKLTEIARDVQQIQM